MQASLRFTWASILTGLALAACSPPIQDSAFRRADLRLLDPVDAESPNLDVIAVYTHSSGRETQIRVDLLDFQREDEFDLYIALDTLPGGTREIPLEGEADLAWDLLLRAPAEGNVEVLRPDLTPLSSPFPETIRRTDKDFTTVKLPTEIISRSGVFRIQVFTAQPGSSHVGDRTEPIFSDSTLQDSANLIIALYNVFPSNTPAQALRSWDGAHSGPAGERFGLLYIFKAIETSMVPVVLLDLKSRESLMGLDYLGLLDRAIALERQGLILLPDVLPAGFPQSTQPLWVLERSAAQARRTALNYGFLGTGALMVPPGPVDLGRLRTFDDHPYTIIFTSLMDSSTSSKQSPARLTRSLTWFPIPLTDTQKSSGTDGGLALEWREHLLQSALIGDRSTVTMVGGDLQATFWGDPLISLDVLEWIAAHPWINVLGPNDLFHRQKPDQFLPDTNPPRRNPIMDYIPFSSLGTTISSGLTVEELQQNALTSLESASQSPGIDIAWRAYFAAIADQVCSSLLPSQTTTECPMEDPSLIALLRANWIGKAGIFVAASEWAAAIEDNSQTYLEVVDLDWDGLNEIVLFDNRYYVVLTPEGGRLDYLFGYDPSYGLVELIGTRSQFVIGWSDPSFWDFTKGDMAERSSPLLEGAFNLNPHDPILYFTELKPNGVSFQGLNGSPMISYSLDQGALLVNISNPGEDFSYEVPLVLAPDLLNDPGWSLGYGTSSHFGEVVWQAGDDFRLEISFNDGSLEVISFMDSPAPITRQEDPNYDYPRGHYLPFPLALVQVTASNEQTIEIRLVSNYVAP